MSGEQKAIVNYRCCVAIAESYYVLASSLRIVAIWIRTGVRQNPSFIRARRSKIYSITEFPKFLRNYCPTLHCNVRDLRLELSISDAIGSSWAA